MLRACIHSSLNGQQTMKDKAYAKECLQCETALSCSREKVRHLTIILFFFLEKGEVLCLTGCVCSPV